MSWLGDALEAAGRFLRGLFSRRRRPTSREVDQAERDAREDAERELRRRTRDR